MSEATSIGHLRHRLRLEAPVTTPADGGGSIVTWTPVATLWAEVVPLSGTEPVTSDRRHGRVTHRVTLRYRTGITSAHRLIHNDRALNIRSVVTPDERRRHLLCICEETTP